MSDTEAGPEATQGVFADVSAPKDTEETPKPDAPKETTSTEEQPQADQDPEDQPQKDEEGTVPVRIAKINIIANAAVPLTENPSEDELAAAQKEANRQARLAAHGMIDEMAEKGMTQSFDTDTKEGKKGYEKFNETQDKIVESMKEADGDGTYSKGDKGLDDLGSGFDKSIGVKDGGVSEEKEEGGEAQETATSAVEESKGKEEGVEAPETTTSVADEKEDLEKKPEEDKPEEKVLDDVADQKEESSQPVAEETQEPEQESAEKPTEKATEIQDSTTSQPEQHTHLEKNTEKVFLEKPDEKGDVADEPESSQADAGEAKPSEKTEEKDTPAPAAPKKSDEELLDEARDLQGGEAPSQS